MSKYQVSAASDILATNPQCTRGSSWGAMAKLPRKRKTLNPDNIGQGLQIRAGGSLIFEGVVLDLVAGMLGLHASAKKE